MLIPVAYGVATAGFLYDNRELIGKMEREIKGILSKSRKESQGYVYELRAIKEGYYLNVRTKQHDVHLKPGDIWKIGDTTKGVGRYKNDSYEFNNFKIIPVFYGTKTEILVEEKRRIYHYHLQNGCLPPGNKIFR